MTTPEIAFVNDEGKVMVADNPAEPNLVVEYVPKSEVERLREVMLQCAEKIETPGNQELPLVAKRLRDV